MKQNVMHPTITTHGFQRSTFIAVQCMVAILICFSLTSPSRVSAVSATTSTTTRSATQSSETTQKLRERIGRVVEEHRDQVRGVLDDMDEDRRGFIGEVQRISAESLTIRTNKGTHILPLDAEVVVVKGATSIESGDIEVGNWLAVMGFDRDDVFQPRRILVSTTSLRPAPRQVALGSLQSLTSTSLTVISRASGEPKIFTVNRSTVFQNSEGETITAREMVTDMDTLVIGSQNGDKAQALLIRSLAPAKDNDAQD